MKHDIPPCRGPHLTLRRMVLFLDCRGIDSLGECQPAETRLVLSVKASCLWTESGTWRHETEAVQYITMTGRENLLLTYT